MVEYVYIEKESATPEKKETPTEPLEERRKEEKEKVNYKVVIAAILGLVLLESVALLTGHNGTLFKIIIIVIAGLAGWSMPQLPLNFKKN